MMRADQHTERSLWITSALCNSIEIEDAKRRLEMTIARKFMQRSNDLGNKIIRMF